MNKNKIFQVLLYKAIVCNCLSVPSELSLREVKSKHQICSLVAVTGRCLLPWQGQNTVPMTKIYGWFLAAKFWLLAIRMLMINALDSGWSGPGSSPGCGFNFLLWGKTFNSHSASLHLGVKISNGEFKAWGKPAMD